MSKSFAWVAAALCAACGSSAYVRVDDVPLGHIVVYRNGIAYYERGAVVRGGTLAVRVPRALVDDFLKTLTVVDRATEQPLPVRFPRDRSGDGDMIDMSLQIPNRTSADVKMTYVTEAPAWKPSYRMVIGNPRDARSKGKVFLEGWAVIDNTSGEDWKDVKIGVGSSSAMSFRYDLWSVRSVERQQLADDQRFASAPPTALAPLPPAPDSVATGEETFSVDANGFSSDGVVVGTAQINDVSQSLPGAVVTGETGGSESIELAGETVSIEEKKVATGRAFESTLGTREPPEPQADRSSGDSAPPPPPDPRVIAKGRVEALARQAIARHRAITITTVTRGATADATLAAQAKRIHDQLVDVGVPGNRIALRTQAKAATDTVALALVPLGEVAPSAAAASDAPIGEERFTAPGLMTVPRETSAMVPILRSETKGEVVYLYDPVSARGDARYAFRAVHLVNPTGETLEGGPIAVYGDDHFIGEGITEQVPPRGTAVVPFALDRQVVVEPHADRKQELRRILAADRGVVRAEMQDLRSTVLTLQSRLAEPTVVFVLHPIDEAWTAIAEPSHPERVAGALLYPIPLAPGERRTVTITEARPLEKDLQLAAPDTTELLAAYVMTPAAEPALKAQLDGLLALHRGLVEQEQRIASLRERAAEYRQRQDELHAEIVTLEKAKTGGDLLDHLRKKMKEVSDRVSETTIAIVDAQEKALVARVKYQDGIAELHLADVTARR